MSQFDYLINSNTIGDKIDRTIKGNSCQILAEDKAVRSFNDSIVYQIIQADTNQTKIIDYKDAARGYFSDLFGRDLCPLTPEKHQVNLVALRSSKKSNFAVGSRNRVSRP